MVQDFCLGHHHLSKASLQTVVDQCINFDKDPFLGPMCLKTLLQYLEILNLFQVFHQL